MRGILFKLWGKIMRAVRVQSHRPQTTMVYLGIEDKEVYSVLMNEIG